MNHKVINVYEVYNKLSKKYRNIKLHEMLNIIYIGSDNLQFFFLSR